MVAELDGDVTGVAALAGFAEAASVVAAAAVASACLKLNCFITCAPE
jgi:hypothetical protein